MDKPYNFVADRTFQVVIGNIKTSTFPEETGISKGSVLAVTLFSRKEWRIIPSDIKHTANVFVYADNIVEYGSTSILT